MHVASDEEVEAWSLLTSLGVLAGAISPYQPTNS